MGRDTPATLPAGVKGYLHFTEAIVQTARSELIGTRSKR